jgi:signal transduction histidine kinase
MNISLKSKLILAFSLVAIVSISSIVIYANLDSERQLNNYLNQGGMYGLGNLVQRLENYYEAQNSWDGVSIAVSTGQGGNRGNPLRKNNRIALVSANLEVIKSEIDAFPAGKTVQEHDLKNSLELNDSAGNVIGYLIVENPSSVTMNDLSPFISRLREVIVVSGIAAAIAAVILAILISNQLLKPVRALTTASKKLSAGDLSTRVTVKGTDELAVLGKTFNQMASNLEALEERKKALTADIAHELRTPLAVQKAQIEAMTDGVVPLDKENLRIVKEQANLLTRMVEDLRLLAMADAGELKLNLQKIQFDVMVQRIVEHYKGQANQEGTAIDVTIADDVKGKFVMADPDRLMQIMHNLFSNALRYGKKGGRIEVVVKNNNDGIEFSVRDDGQGIPVSALPHLFERFYRHEKARNRESGGSGLGLAISKKLALIMGGDLRAANDPRGGAVFTLFLPNLSD